DDVLCLPPVPFEGADYIVVESTYGDRLHDRGDPAEQLAAVVTRTAKRGGVVLVPAFAVGRAQQVLLHLAHLKAQRRIPDVPIFLNSPMASQATRMLDRHLGDHRLTR